MTRAAIQRIHYAMGLFALLAPFSATCSAETIAITGAHVYAMTSAESLENATIVIRDGRVDAVGVALAVPTEARVIDAGGRIVTPGLMTAGSQLGLVEVHSATDTADSSVTSGPLGAAFDVEYALNPNSTLLVQARADGLSRAVCYPTGSAGAPFSGSGAVLRLIEGAEIIDRSRIAMFAITGGMEAEQVGGSRSAQWILLRNALDEARQYRPRSKVSGPRDQLLNRLDIEALRPVVEGRMPLAIEAQRESDIRQAIRLSDDYGVRVIVYGGTEAWHVADLLASRKIPIVLNPLDNLPSTFDKIGARADNAAILQKAGVTIAFAVPGIHMSHNAGTVIREVAGTAVANGLPWIEALKALTVNPARIFDVADHYGTLSPGQDADLVIWDGDPLEPSSAPQTVLLRGSPVSLETRQTKLRDRYSPLHRNDPWPPGYR